MASGAAGDGGGSDACRGAPAGRGPADDVADDIFRASASPALNVPRDLAYGGAVLEEGGPEAGGAGSAPGPADAGAGPAVADGGALDVGGAQVLVRELGQYEQFEEPHGVVDQVELLAVEHIAARTPVHNASSCAERVQGAGLEAEQAAGRPDLPRTDGQPVAVAVDPKASEPGEGEEVDEEVAGIVAGDLPAEPTSTGEEEGVLQHQDVHQPAVDSKLHHCTEVMLAVEQEQAGLLMQDGSNQDADEQSPLHVQVKKEDEQMEVAEALEAADGEARMPTMLKTPAKPPSLDRGSEDQTQPESEPAIEASSSWEPGALTLSPVVRAQSSSPSPQSEKDEQGAEPRELAGEGGGSASEDQAQMPPPDREGWTAAWSSKHSVRVPPKLLSMAKRPKGLRFAAGVVLVEQRAADDVG